MLMLLIYCKFNMYCIILQKDKNKDYIFTKYNSFKQFQRLEYINRLTSLFYIYIVFFSTLKGIVHPKTHFCH